jgi:hypothetical protein
MIFVTKGGNIRPPLSSLPRKGDLICILLGYQVLVILCPKLLGEALMLAIMQGEGILVLEAGEKQLQQFEI